jgi:23S rRNA U2552 (ribose-2'-O)-methylase RlmE/FtsJ
VLCERINVGLGKGEVASPGKEKIVAVDLMAMAPIEGTCMMPSLFDVTVLHCSHAPGVRFLQGDITRQCTAKEITEHFEGSLSLAYAHIDG